MYKNIALANGFLLAVMVFFNGMLANRIGPYVSTLIFHVLGFGFILILSIIMKNRFPRLRKISGIFFLPWVLGVITILLNNICIPQIGITLTIGASLYGQLVCNVKIYAFLFSDKIYSSTVFFGRFYRSVNNLLV